MLNIFIDSIAIEYEQNIDNDELKYAVTSMAH